MLSSVFIWSLFPAGAIKVVEELPKVGAALNTDGKDVVVEEAVLKEKADPGETPVDAPKAMDAELLLPKGDEPAPKAKSVKGDELNVEPKGEEDFEACQLEPKMLAAALLELAGLLSKEEEKGLPPKILELPPELELTMLLLPKLKVGAAALLELLAFADEEVAKELAPKLNPAGAPPPFELIAFDTDEEDEALIPEVNMLEVAPLPVLTDLVSAEEPEVLRPKPEPVLSNLVAIVEELDRALLEVNDVTPEVPRTEDDAEEPN